MGKKIRSLQIVSLLLVFCISLGITPVYATQYEKINGIYTMKVIKVIDGNSIIVQNNTNKSESLVRLAGVDTEGYDKAYEFLNNLIYGQNVLLVPSQVQPDDRWNYMYVNYNGYDVNGFMIESGYGKLDLATVDTTRLDKYQSFENQTKNEKINIWDDGTVKYDESYNEKTININTATSTQLRELDGITSSIASNIIKYRQVNPFNSKEEIKFVKGMTNSIYEDIKNNISVVTNVNRASSYEIATLEGISTNEANDIVKYRSKNGNLTEDILIKNGLMSNSEYSNNQGFVSFDNKRTIDIAEPSTVVNINTASESQLKDAGLTSSRAKYYVDYRTDYKYIFRTMQELYTIESNKFSTTDIDKYSDNLIFMTNVNTATKTELMSLFGDGYSSYDKEINTIMNNRPYEDSSKLLNDIGSTAYNKISPYISIAQTNIVNINTATVEQMNSVGINNDKAEKLYDYTKDIKTLKTIPYDVTGNRENISIYTNINTASAKELTSLSPNITSSFANTIINYRDDSVFGNLEEFEDFMRLKGMQTTYDDIKKYVTVK